MTAAQAVFFMNPPKPASTRKIENRPRALGDGQKFDRTEALGQHAQMQDPELVERFLDGDASAVKVVEAWVRSSAGAFRQPLADEWEDAVQDAMIAVLEELRAGRFEGRSTLKTYVWRMTAYRLTDRFRAQKKRHWIALEAEPLRDDRPDPLKRAQERDRWRVARRVMSRLSENCRHLWRMTLAGLDYAQMSEELTVSAGTLRVRMLRCRDRALKLEEKLSLPAVGGA